MFKAKINNEWLGRWPRALQLRLEIGGPCMHIETHTHTYIYYKVHYTRVRLRLRWSEIWGPFRCFFTLDMQLKMIENLRGSSVNGRFSQISLQLAVTSWWDCPCFCLPESCFSLPPLKLGAKSFPPAGIHVDLPLEGIFTGKHQQFESTLSEIGRYNSWSFRGAARENYLIDCTLWY